MPVSIAVELDLDTAPSPDNLARAAALQHNLAPESIREARLVRRSLDARRPPPRWICQVVLYTDHETPPPAVPPTPLRHPVGDGPTAVVVGCGPAGMFAALRLLELGIRPIVLERGKDAQARRHDLAAITRRGEVNPDSNYCFGEGGAGTYSDGKLYTRSNKRGNIEAILRTLVAHGAPADILTEAHPHIGSNRLPRVVTAMRETIVACGGEVRFGTRVVDYILRSGRLCGVRTAAGAEVMGEAVILATGHSARDVFEGLVQAGIRVESKPFAMGVRVEHPQPLIDRLQYKCSPRPLALPAASYRLAHTADDRGVFSFCMCPGGWIVPAATAPGEVVVNGMSLSRRDSPFANSGIVVSVEATDLSPFASHGPLAGLRYQQAVEQAACQAAGGRQQAPAQRLLDFVQGRVSADLPPSSYHPGLVSVPLHELLPAALATRLQQGFRAFGGAMRGFLTADAVVVGVESRTSSPVRIPRDPASLEHPDVAGLYPCGEGGGYAGGIVSAAMDGVRVAEALAARVVVGR
jgi:uncharacterized protein